MTRVFIVSPVSLAMVTIEAIPGRLRLMRSLPSGAVPNLSVFLESMLLLDYLITT